jgi:murein L,D-transpeptidase YcbB/YkuD
MAMKKSIRIFYRFMAILFFFSGMQYSCQEPPPPKPKEIVKKPELLNPKTSEIIEAALNYAEENGGKVNDSIRLEEISFLKTIYTGSPVKRIWSNEKSWLPMGDAMYSFIVGSENYGLFPEDYHLRVLKSVRNQLKDSIAMTDAALWARSDLMLTDAFIHMARHLKFGRLERDSTTLRMDSVFSEKQVISLFSRLSSADSIKSILESLEPIHAGYREIRELLPSFLDSMDRQRYTYIDFPKKDSITYVKQLQSRLFEDSYITFNTRMPDSVELSEAIRKAQAARGLTVDGKSGPQLVRSLNNTGWERFARIAINLDRYKHLPDSMPLRYVWVNLPAYSMQLIDSGIVIMESKVIVGQPKTRTPVLQSEITNFITYPQWTVPFSIIIKEMLPKIQKSTDYLLKQNLMVVDRNDSIIPPDSINWSKLSKTYFPYQLKQREGDDNSLGVIKFNFRNKYSVYLHDTNARGLFSRGNRAMSHGCVRVQEWKQFAENLVYTDTIKYHPDTLAAWILRGEKHTVGLQKRTPIFLRYFTTYVSDGKIKLYDDIYSDDKLLRDRYFAKRL